MRGPEMSIGLIGVGAVGQAVAATLVTAGAITELVICSRTTGSATALAADVADLAAALGAPVQVRAVAGPDELAGCRAVIIAARATFTNAVAGPDIRVGGLIANAPVIAGLAAALRDYPGPVLMVTNPVDVMARLFGEVSGCRVWGIGAGLDSARYRLLLAARLRVPVADVAGRVLGEHGTGLVVCASTTRVGGRPVTVPLADVVDELHGRAPGICAGIGRTRSGPAGAVLTALRLALGLADGVTELSAPYQAGVWLGLPVRFHAGVAEVLTPVLAPPEAARLSAAATKLAGMYASLRAVITLPAPRTENHQTSAR